MRTTDAKRHRMITLRGCEHRRGVDRPRGNQFLVAHFAEPPGPLPGIRRKADASALGEARGEPDPRPCPGRKDAAWKLPSPQPPSVNGNGIACAGSQTSVNWRQVRDQGPARPTESSTEFRCSTSTLRFSVDAPPSPDQVPKHGGGQPGEKPSHVAPLPTSTKAGHRVPVVAGEFRAPVISLGVRATALTENGHATPPGRRDPPSAPARAIRKGVATPGGGVT